MNKFDYQHFIELLLAMTEKEVRSRYKNTMFGFLWIIINPLLQMLVIGFVFRFFIREQIDHYNYHLFIGLLVWNFFSLSLTKSTPSIVYERSLIKKAKFPNAVIPLSIVGSNCIHLLISFGLLLIPIIFLGTMTLTGFLYSCLSIILLCCFTSGLSLLTSSLNVRFRDTSFFVQALLIIWFYATPIIYSLSLIPNDLLWLWRFNPLTSILQFLQFGLLGSYPPGPAMIVCNIFFIILTSIIGIKIFQQESKYFDDWI